MEDNNNMDTPQPKTPADVGMDPFGGPVVEGSSENTENISVNDAFFGQTESDNQTAPEQGLPAENQETAPTEEPYEAKNDDKRFEYWQSQAAKKENELRTYQQEVEQAMQNQSMQQPAPEQLARPVEEFPPPPKQPEKPRGFSREEAWSDSTSESARYLDEMDSWNTDMGDYRDLRNQYDIALVREQLQAEQNAKREAQAQRQEYNERKKQVQEVYQHVRGHYGFNPEDAKEFVKSMSDPNSVSMDNLVQLYRMNKGGAQAPQNTQGPSDAFQQSKNAQQVPSPMGVMPSQSSQSNRSDTDQIMDSMISDFKNKNPFN